jgi:hypothetical protein
MPLHAEHETPARKLHGLDDPVLGVGRRDEAAAQIGDRLVMRAQDGRPSPEDRRRRATGLRRHLRGSEHRRGDAVPIVAHYVGHVLVQRTPQLDVEDLAPRQMASTGRSASNAATRSARSLASRTGLTPATSVEADCP